MSSDLEIRQRLRRLSGPADTRGVWESIEAQAEKIGVSRVSSHRLRTATLVGAALVLVVGGAVGAPVAAHYIGGQDVRVINDDMNMAAQLGNVQIGTWTRLPLKYEGTQVTYLAIDPTNSAVLYASTGRGLFKSEDAAESWRQLPNLSGVDWIAIDPASPLTIFVVRWMDISPQLLRSLDGGMTWTDVGAEVMRDDLTTNLLGGMETPMFDTTSQPSTVYVSAPESGAWKSLDQGDTWVKLSPEEEQQMWAKYAMSTPTCIALSDVLIDPADPTICYKATVSGVSKSIDGGAHWREVSRGLTSSATETLALDPSSPANLYAATPKGIIRSGDAGKTWTAILGGGAGEGADGSSWYASGSVVVSPSSPSRIYARTPIGLFRSDNGGADWTSLAGQGLPSTQVPGVDDRVLLVAANDPDIVFSTSANGIYRSSDGGETWNRVLDGMGKLVAYPHDLSTLYAVLWGQDEILRSVDEGATWSVTASGPWAGPLWDLVVDSRTPAGLYLVQSDATGTGPRTVSRSTDGGATWSPIDLGAPSTSIVSLVFSPRSADTLYVWTQRLNGMEPLNSIYRSTDAGATWQDLSFQGVTDSMCAVIAAPGSEEALYVVGYDGVFQWVPEEE